MGTVRIARTVRHGRTEDANNGREKTVADTFQKRVRKDPFTRINNTIFMDHELSLKARGLLCTALSLPDGWAFSIRGLMALSRDGRAAVVSALDELEVKGYLQRTPQQGRRENGQFSDMDYVFFDSPRDVTDAENQHRTDAGNQHRTDVENQHRTDVDFPHAENPHAENQQQETTKQEKILDIPPYIPPEGEPPPETKRKRYEPDSNPYRCAAFLDGSIRKRLPEKKAADEGTLQKWADAFDKCQRLDGYSWPLIGQVLRFSQNDEFWQKNILSGRSFRAKFTQLYAKAAMETRPSQTERVGLPKGVDWL